MAEISFLEATIHAILRDSSTIIRLCVQYQQSLSHARIEAQRLQGDVRGFELLAEHAQRFLTSGGANSSILVNETGSWKQGHALLASIEESLRVSFAGWEHFNRRLRWPFAKGESDVMSNLLRRAKLAIEQEMVVATELDIDRVRINVRLAADTSAEIEELTRLAIAKTEVINAVHSLDGPDQSIRQGFLSSKRTAHTTQWLLDSKSYCDWKASNPTSLWIHGPPGCGKSTLASAIVDDLRKEHRPLAYFYFEFSNRHRSTVNECLRALVSQLLKTMGRLPESAKFDRILDCDSGKRKLVSKINLMALLKACLQANDTSYIIFDAYDECPEPQSFHIMIQDILAWKVKHLKTSLVGGHSDTVADVLCSAVSLEVPIRSADTIRDIERYMHDSLQHLACDPQLECLLKKQLETVLNGQHSGSFRLAECQMHFLRRRLNLSSSCTIIDDFPQSLTQSYELSMRNLRDNAAAQLLLSWLAVSYRPLSVAEATEVLALGAHEDSTVQFDPAHRSGALDTLALCFDFIIVVDHISDYENVDNLRISLAHETVRDWLLQPQALSFQRRSLSCVHDVHAHVCKKLLLYLNFMQQHLIAQHVPDRPLARFAAEFWMSHFKAAMHRQAILSDDVLKLLSYGPAYSNWRDLFHAEDPWRSAESILQDSDISTRLSRWDPSPLLYATLLGSKAIFLRVSDALLSTGMMESAPIRSKSVAGRSIPEQEQHHGDMQGEVEHLSPDMWAASLDLNDQGHLSVPSWCSGPDGADTSLSVASKLGFTFAATHLLKHVRVSQRECLISAVQHDHYGVTKALLEHGSNPNTSSRHGHDDTPFEVAARFGSKACIAVMIPYCTNNTLLAGLHTAFKCHTLSVDMLRLFQSQLPNATLIYAASLGYDDLAKELLSKGAKTESPLRTRSRNCLSKERPGSALVGAVNSRNLALIRVLLQAGADVNALHGETKDGYALICAAHNGDMELVKLLLNAGAMLESCMSGFATIMGTALCVAAFCGHSEVVQYLLDRGASVYVMEQFATQPVEAAIQGGSVESLQHIVHAGAHVDIASLMTLAVEKNQSSILRWLIDYQVRVESVDCTGLYDPLLITAAESGHTAIIKQLLDAGARIEYRATDGRYNGTALSRAVVCVKKDAVDLLIANGCDVNVSGGAVDQQQSALAAVCDSAPNLLYEKGRVIARDRRHNAHALIVAGANLHARNGPDKECALHIASRVDNKSLVRLLVERGARVNEQDEHGRTAVILAAGHGNAELLQMLLSEFGADATVTLPDGHQAIHVAARYDQSRCIDVLLSAGVDIETRSAAGSTALHVAAHNLSEEAITSLIANGADQNARETFSDLTARECVLNRWKLDHDDLWPDPVQRVLDLFTDTEGDALIRIV